MKDEQNSTNSPIGESNDFNDNFMSSILNSPFPYEYEVKKNNHIKI